MSEVIKNEAAATGATETNVITELRKFLESYGGGAETLKQVVSLGVESVDDLASLSDGELVECGLKLVQARKLLKSFKEKEAPAETPAAPARPAAPAVINMEAVLPAVPDEGSWLNDLKTGGVLKVNDATYIGAIRAAMAYRCGLYNVPDILLKKLEEQAESLDEPVGDSFYKLRKTIVRRDYAEIFSAIDGVDGQFATTKERRSKFLKSLDNILWPAIRRAYEELDAWYDAACASMANPTILMAALSGQAAAGFGVTTPSFDSISSACDDLKDQINKVFRGTAIPVSAALAYDAKKITEILADSTLPAQIGAGNRDQMLKMLGLNINSSYTRQEQCIVRFVLSYIKFNDNAVGNEMQYLGALWQLGRAISWDSLGYSARNSGTSSLGGNRTL